MFQTLSRRSVFAALLPAFFAATHLAQRAPQPEPTLIQDVYLGRERDETKKFSLLLRDGVIAEVLEAGTPAPPGVRVIDGRDLLCLPAFVDAYSTTGCETPEPAKDQDQPVDVTSDVRIDMRLANRKGLQPAFRALAATAFKKEDGEAWRKAGFGAALIAPEGELLSGSSTLVSTREAALRDLVLHPDVFAHGAFAANGGGYPSTLMGYIAQLRQFFLDAKRQEELTRRYAQGRPGLRPPHDAELEEGQALLSRKKLLVCEAEGHRDMERWFKLADQFGLRVGFSGGRDAWRVAEELAERDAPVVLTLDWGKEVKDPLAKDKKKARAGEEGEAKSPEDSDDEQAPEEETPEEETAEEETTEEETTEEEEDETEKRSAEEQGDEGEKKAKRKQGDEADEKDVWEYTEPLGVRVEKRRLWEEGRDCAVRLSEAGVRFAFGTKARKPEKLLADVRQLVEVGLEPDKALDALTVEPARLIGVEHRLGRVSRGYNATLCLWSEDPLTEKKAQVLWTFVDGFPTKYERKKEKKKADKGGPPGEGLDMSGTWAVEFPDGEGIKSAKLVLLMDEDGNISGSIFMTNPRDDSEVESPIEGALSGERVVLEASIAFGEFKIDLGFDGTLESDRLEGESTFSAPFMSEPSNDPFHATRQPDASHEMEESAHSHSGHPH